MTHGGQATQVSVSMSHELPGTQATNSQLPPGLAFATHTVPVPVSVQVQVGQVRNVGDPTGAHGRSSRPATADAVAGAFDFADEPHPPNAAHTANTPPIFFMTTSRGKT